MVQATIDLRVEAEEKQQKEAEREARRYKQKGGKKWLQLVEHLELMTLLAMF